MPVSAWDIAASEARALCFMVQSAGEEKRSPALSEVRALPADPEDAARDMLTKAPGRGATVAELESADPEPETVKHPQASSSQSRPE